MRFSINQFRGMVYRLVREAREELFKKLMIVKVGIDQKVDIKQVPLIH
jgi:hypothetical protein